MQSLSRDKVRVSEEQILSSFSTQQNIHNLNLKRYQKLYRDYENHLRQDLERQKAELQNSEIVQNLLKKIKKQIFEQLKQLQSLDHQAQQGLSSQQQIGEQKKKPSFQIEDKDNNFLQSILTFNNNRPTDSQNLIKDQRDRENEEELSQLRQEIQRYKKLYLQVDQRLNQEMIDYHPHQPTNSQKIKQVNPQLLKRKLQLVLMQKNKDIQAKQVNPQQNVVFLQKKQLQLKLLIRGKQVEEYRDQIDKTHKKLRNLQSQMAKLEIHSRQVKQLRNQNSLLKMKIFGLQNVQTIPTEVLQIESNLPELVKSQIFNLKNRGQKQEQQTKQNNLLNNHYQLVKQYQQKLKEDMIRQSLAASLKQYKKKYSELQKRYSQKEQQFKTFIEKTKVKINDYNALIQRLHFQLQKSYVQISERSEKSHMIQAYKSLQQKIEAVSSKNTLLNKQIGQKQELFHKEKLKFQSQRKALKIENQRLNRENYDLKISVRQFKNQMLQQQLNLEVWKSQNQNNTNVQKVRLALNQQITVLRSQYEEKNDLLLKEMSKNQRLNEVNENLQRQLQQNKSQNLRLIQKNQQIHSKLTQSNRFSEQLQNTKQKLEQGEQQTQNLQKKVAHYLNETKEYQNRVRELEQILNALAHQNEQKNNQLMRVINQNSQLAHRIQKLQEQFDIFEQKGSSLKKIQYINRSSELQSEVQTLKKDYNQAIDILNTRQHQIQNLKSDCDRYIEQNLRYLKFIRQKSLEIDEGFLEDEKHYEQERNNRIQQLQQKIHNLVQDNELLKNLVEEMRNKLNEKNMPSPGGFASKHQDQIQELRNALLSAENTIQNYKNQVIELQERCNTQKSVFKDQWNKLIAQYNDRSRSQKSGQDNLNEYSKIQNKIELSQNNKLLKKELQRKQEEIRMLKNALQKNAAKQSQNRIENFDAEKVPEYYRELISLRQQLQKLKQQRFHIQSKVRQLEQENSSLKIKLISSNNYETSSNLNHPQSIPTQIVGNLGSKSIFKSAHIDPEVLNSQRDSQALKQLQTQNFKNLVYLAPLVESVQGQQSIARLSHESR